MHWGKISVVSVIASMMTCGASAEEGVVVDLDVLNNLDAGYYSAQEPLFPVLPKRPVNQVKKKNVVKTAKPLPTVKAENSTSSMVVKKSDAAKKEVTLPKVDTAKSEKDDFVVVVDREPVAEPIEKTLPQAVEQQPEASFYVKPEEKPIIAEALSVNKETIAEENNAQKIKDAKEESVVKNTESSSQPADKTIKNETIVPEEKAELNNSTDENSVSSAENDNIMPEKDDDSATQEGIIRFADTSDILNVEQQELLDKIISGFSNEKTSKIAIYAYNFDDGVDSFRKKRITLNRAIEIRSYLLKKGFKNFNIKVVNISGNSKKVNCVELKEI